MTKLSIARIGIGGCRQYQLLVLHFCFHHLIQCVDAITFFDVGKLILHQLSVAAHSILPFFRNVLSCQKAQIICDLHIIQRNRNIRSLYIISVRILT